MANGRRRGKQPASNAAEAVDLTEEIVRLRELIRQMEEAFNAQSELSHRLRIMAIICQSSARLAQVLKVQNQLGGGSALVQEIQRVADQVRQELESRGWIEPGLQTGEK